MLLKLFINLLLTNNKYYFITIKYGDKIVVVSRTEIGIIKYFPDLIINQGTSGGHDPKLHAGDIVLAEKVINIGAVKTERKEYEIQQMIKTEKL